MVRSAKRHREKRSRTFPSYPFVVGRVSRVTTVFLIKENGLRATLVYQLAARYLNRLSFFPSSRAKRRVRAAVPRRYVPRLNATRGTPRGVLSERSTLMDRARSFATIGRALYMAQPCSQVPDFRKSPETLSQPIGARTERASNGLYGFHEREIKRDQPTGRPIRGLAKQRLYNVSFTS